MKRPNAFPYEYKAGGMIFHVYLAPLAKTLTDGTQKHYESFLVKYRKYRLTHWLNGSARV